MTTLHLSEKVRLNLSSLGGGGMGELRTPPYGRLSFERWRQRSPHCCTLSSQFSSQA